MFTEPQRIAALRALYGGALTFALTALAGYQATRNWSGAVIAGTVAGLTYLAARGGVEGWVDSPR